MTNHLQDSKRGAFERNMLETAKGGGFLAAGSLFEFGNRFIIAFLLARVLGAGEYGLYDLATSIAALIAGISSLGLDSAMVRYVAILAGKRDHEGVWGTLQIGIGVSALVSILMGAGLFVLAQPIAEHLFREPRLIPMLRLFSVVVPFLTLSNVLAGAARGFKRMDYSALAENVIQSLVKVVLLGILALVGLNAFTAAIVFGLSDLAATIALIYLLHKEFSFKRPLHQARRDFREISSFSLPLWLSGLLKKFRKNLEILLLGMLSSVTSVGIFSIAGKINLIGHVAYLSIIASVKPILARLIDQGNRDQIGHLYRTATRWTLMLNLPVFLIMVSYPEQLLGIFGQSYVAGAAALVVLAFAELANAGTGICGSIIDMAGYTKLKLLNSIIWIALLVISNLLLIPRWGVLGAATASTIAMATVNLLRVLQVWFLLRIVPYDRTFIKPVAASLVALLGAQLLGQWVSADSTMAHTALHVLVVLAVYAGVSLILGLAPEDRTVVVRLRRRAGLLFARSRARLTGRLPASSG